MELPKHREILLLSSFFVTCSCSVASYFQFNAMNMSCWGPRIVLRLYCGIEAPLTVAVCLLACLSAINYRLIEDLSRHSCVCANYRAGLVCLGATRQG